MSALAVARVIYGDLTCTRVRKVLILMVTPEEALSKVSEIAGGG